MVSLYKNLHKLYQKVAFFLIKLYKVRKLAKRSRIIFVPIVDFFGTEWYKNRNVQSAD